MQHVILSASQSTGGGVDYGPISPSSLTFPTGTNDGETLNFTIGISDDSLVERVENFEFNILTPDTDALVSQSSATVNIADNDSEPILPTVLCDTTLTIMQWAGYACVYLSRASIAI